MLLLTAQHRLPRALADARAPAVLAGAPAAVMLADARAFAVLAPLPLPVMLAYARAPAVLAAAPLAVMLADARAFAVLAAGICSCPRSPCSCSSGGYAGRCSRQGVHTYATRSAFAAAASARFTAVPVILATAVLKRPPTSRLSDP